MARKIKSELQKRKERLIKEKMLQDLKTKHFLEKKHEIERIKARLQFLEQEMVSYNDRGEN